MKRREVIRSGVGMMAVGLADRVFGQIPCPPTLDGSPANDCPAPSGTAEWSWDVASLQDETDFYTNILGWSIPSNARSFTSLGDGGYPWTASSNYNSFVDMHNLTEGDVLWTWDQQYKRFGTVDVGSGSTTADWRNDLIAYYKDNLLSKLDSTDGDSAPSGIGFDHMYGRGIATIYNDTGDSELLTVMDGLKTRLLGRSAYQKTVSRLPVNTSYYLGRGYARWCVTAAYVAQATGDTEWETIRDNLAWGYETSLSWEEGGAIQNGGGCFFASSAQAGYDGISGFAGGRRYESTFSLGLTAEAMWRMYIQTGSATLRDRLIKMARYVQYYAHDPSWVGPHVGSRFGHEGDGSRFYGGGGGDSGSELQARGDCSYDMSVINTLIVGYKLTGDTAFLDRARIHFSRGNRWDPGTPTIMWADSINHVHKYLDTQCDLTNREFQFNKGALQYCYMIFENGGRPNVLASVG